MGDGVDMHQCERHMSPESKTPCSLNCRKVAPKKLERRLPARARPQTCVGDAFLYALYSREPAALGFGFVV